jgi:large subunit ribosomal protein L7Ae
MVDVNKESAAQALQLLNEVRIQGKIRKGTNEVTKSVERGEAKLVVIAADVNPPEIIMHIPILCAEKNIPHIFVESKAELGAAAGLPVGTSAVAVANAGDAARKLNEFVDVLKGKMPKPIKKEAPIAAQEVKEEKPSRKPRAKKETKEVAVAQATTG